MAEENLISDVFRPFIHFITAAAVAKPASRCFRRRQISFSAAEKVQLPRAAGFRGGADLEGHNRRTPPPKPDETDRPAPIFSSHCQSKGHAIYLIIDSEIFLTLTALAAHFTLFVISNTDRLD